MGQMADVFAATTAISRNVFYDLIRGGCHFKGIAFMAALTSRLLTALFPQALCPGGAVFIL